jgi:hypothetical protein
MPLRVQSDAILRANRGAAPVVIPARDSSTDRETAPVVIPAKAGIQCFLG